MNTIDKRWARFVTDNYTHTSTTANQRLLSNAYIAKFVADTIKQNLNDCMHSGFIVDHSSFQKRLYVQAISRKYFFVFMDSYLGTEEANIFAMYHGFHSGSPKSPEELAKDFHCPISDIICILEFVENQLSQPNIAPFLPIFTS